MMSLARKKRKNAQLVENIMVMLKCEKAMKRESRWKYEEYEQGRRLLGE